MHYLDFLEEIERELRSMRNQGDYHRSVFKSRGNLNNV